MDLLDEILKEHDLKFEDLNAEERETAFSMLSAIQQNQLTIEKIRDAIRSMKNAVENELTRYDLGSKQDIFLKARLRNYMLLEQMLMSPDRAKQALDAAVGNIRKK